MSTGHFPRGSVFSESSRITVELAGRVDGVTCRELAVALQQPADWCTAKLAKLVASGALHRARQTGHRLHWFTTPRAAADWQKRTRSIVPLNTGWAGQKLVLSPSKATRHAKQKMFAVAAPVQVRKTSGSGEVIVPPGLKVQRIPSPEFFGPAALVKVSSKARVKGDFSKLGIGRYIE